VVLGDMWMLGLARLGKKLWHEKSKSLHIKKLHMDKEISK
jgi:hypothetical protein